MCLLPIVNVSRVNLGYRMFSVICMLICLSFTTPHLAIPWLAKWLYAIAETKLPKAHINTSLLLILTCVATSIQYSKKLVQVSPVMGEYMTS